MISGQSTIGMGGQEGGAHASKLGMLESRVEEQRTEERGRRRCSAGGSGSGDSNSAVEIGVLSFGAEGGIR